MKIGLWVDDTSSIIGHLHDVQAAGFDAVVACLVKHDPVPIAVPHQPDNLAQLRHGAASIGMGLQYWGYAYPSNYMQQAGVIANLIPADATDLILDMEVEWESTDPATQNDLAASANTFMHNLAEMTSHRTKLWLSSFCNPRSHPLPYTEILKHCEGLMPQSYQFPVTPPAVVATRTLTQAQPLALASLGGQLVPTVNTPEMLLALHETDGLKAACYNAWLWEGGGTDPAVRDNITAWRTAIAIVKGHGPE